MREKQRRIRVHDVVCILIAIPLPLFCQQSSATKAPCSPIAPYNKGIINIQCKVESGKDGKQLVEILNRIKESQLSLDSVLKEIGEMEANIKDIHDQQEMSGLLLPANDPSPDNVCDHGPFQIPSGMMFILLGNSASFTNRFPHSVIVVKGEPVLTLNQKGDQLAVSAKIFSADGKIVAEIIDNEFSINPNNYFRKERPDKSTLVVYDQEGKKVLDVRFINPNTIRFLGILNYPQLQRPLVISQTEGLFSNTICSGLAGRADFAIN